MYKLIFDGLSQDVHVVQRLSDNAFIPFDPANTDAQQFAKWMQEGNRPESADEGGIVTDEWVAETIDKLLPPNE